jgi:subtilisin family serine protease
MLAPGRDVPSAAPGGGWALVTGSSFAAAHASGLLALVRELDAKGLQPGVLKTAFVTAAQGRIDGCATLARHAGSRGTACAALGQTPD